MFGNINIINNCCRGLHGPGRRGDDLGKSMFGLKGYELGVVGMGGEVNVKVTQKDHCVNLVGGECIQGVLEMG